MSSVNFIEDLQKNLIFSVGPCSPSDPTQRPNINATEDIDVTVQIFNKVPKENYPVVTFKNIKVAIVNNQYVRQVAVGSEVALRTSLTNNTKDTVTLKAKAIASGDVYNPVTKTFFPIIEVIQVKVEAVVEFENTFTIEKNSNSAIQIKPKDE